MTCVTGRAENELDENREDAHIIKDNPTALLQDPVHFFEKISFLCRRKEVDDAIGQNTVHRF
jgi:hypothetical protein